MPKVSVIIANWNGRHLLADCLNSLMAQTFMDFETIVVDNGSSDGSIEYISENFEHVTLIKLAENTGYACANNIGLEHATGEYIVTLNNDTRAEPGWLEELVRVAGTDSRIGMVGSRTCKWNEVDTIDTLGGRICRDGMSRGAYRGRAISDLGLPSIVPILYPSPSAALYRRSMLEDTGFFDEAFFAFAEDTDLGLRARWMDWDAVAATAAVVHHRFSATGGVISPLKVFLVERNHFRVAVKNFPLSWLIFVPFWTVIRISMQIQSVLAGEGTGAEFNRSGNRSSLVAATLRGQLAALAGLPDAWSKRRQIMGKARISPPDMLRLLNRHRLSFKCLFDCSELD